MFMTLAHLHTCHVPKNDSPLSRPSHPSQSRPQITPFLWLLALVDCGSQSQNGTVVRIITPKQVLFCLDLVFTLISLMKCDIVGYSALLKDHKCTISDLHRTMLGQIPLTGGLYQHQYSS